MIACYSYSYSLLYTISLPISSIGRILEVRGIVMDGPRKIEDQRTCLSQTICYQPPCSRDTSVDISTSSL